MQASTALLTSCPGQDKGSSSKRRPSTFSAVIPNKTWASRFQRRMVFSWSVRIRTEGMNSKSRLISRLAAFKEVLAKLRCRRPQTRCKRIVRAWASASVYGLRLLATRTTATIFSPSKMGTPSNLVMATCPWGYPFFIACGVE